jgi:hypothetical protein
MGTSLFNTTPAATYPALIKVGNNTSLDGTLKVLSDGSGNDSILSLSTASLQIGGQSSFFSTQSAGTGSDFFYSDINPNLTAGANNQVVSLVRLRDRGVANTGGFTGTQRLSLIMENAAGGQFPFQLFSESGALRIGFTSVATPTARVAIQGTGATSATTSFLVTNGAATPLNAMQITDNLGIIFAGKGQDNSGVYIGRDVAASWTNSYGSVVIGDAADVAGNAINQVIIGKEAIGTASNNINIGYRAGVLGSSNGTGILIGYQAGQHGATNYPTNPIGIGSSVGVGTNSISIGTSAKTTGVDNSIAIGNASEVYYNPSFGGINAIALGANSFANTSGAITDGTAIAIGYDAYANYYEFVSGSPTFPIKDVYFGSGVIRKNGLSTGVGVAYTINGSGAFGTNFAGGNLTLAGGKGTGTGTAGSVIFSTSTPTTSGTTLQTLSERMRIDGSGNVGIGTTSPTARLQVVGSGSTSGTESLKITDSAGTNLFRVRDDGRTIIGTGGITFEGSTISSNTVLTIGGNGGLIFSNATLNFQRNTTFDGGIGVPSNATQSGITIIGNFTNAGAGLTSVGNNFNITTALNTSIGDVTLNQLNITNTINTTGGTTLQRGFYYNPTLTGTVGFTHYAIQTTSGGAYINTATPNATACLQADSTTQGFLPPRMTTAERVAITSPANGLIVFDTDVQNLCYRRDSTWVQVSFTAV